MTGAMMVLTLKIISAAACYQDGSRPDQVYALNIHISCPANQLSSRFFEVPPALPDALLSAPI